jgi:hypothetical protein
MQAAGHSLVTLQKQYDQLSAQQTHWDELRLTSEKIDMLTTLISQADHEELKGLRHIRDRCKVLEGEHAALQKHLKDQETKVANSERTLTVARHGLSQAQQRALEWETRAQDYAAKLEIVQTKLDQTEQTHAQLNADHSMVTLQLEEEQAENRLAKVNTLRFLSHYFFSVFLQFAFRIARIISANKLRHWKTSWLVYRANSSRPGEKSSMVPDQLTVWQMAMLVLPSTAVPEHPFCKPIVQSRKSPLRPLFGIQCMHRLRVLLLAADIPSMFQRLQKHAFRHSVLLIHRRPLARSRPS